MSTPRNPLDEYRSYSYHTILIVSNTTEALTTFTSSDPANDASALMAISNTMQGEVIKTDKSVGEALLVLDSRRTSSFSIREFEYNAYPGVGIPSQTHVIQGTLNMTIIDPDGIGFINYLRYLIDEKLKTDLIGVHFLLKVIFVGHKADGSTTLISSSGIPLMLYTIEFEVNYKEGVYKCIFVPMSQNVGTVIKNFTAVQDVKSITAEDGKLGTVIRNFENKINENYRNWYKNLNIELRKSGDVNSTPIGKTGRLIQVMITIPKDWEQFTIDNASFNKQIERRFDEEIQKKKESQDKEIKEKQAANEKEIQETEKKGVTREAAEKLLKKEFIGFSPTLNIYEILSEILKLSPEANELANRKAVAANLVKTFKTVSSVTSNNEVMLIHFDILEYVVPNITIKNANSEWTVDRPDGTKVPKNSLEFDYIFTGKNTDILEFNLKMNNAQLLFMNTGLVGALTHRQVTDQKKQPDNPITPTKVNIGLVRENDPIGFPIQTIETRKSFAYSPERVNTEKQAKNQSDRNEWLQTVSKLHSITQVQAKVTIRGNPNLLNKYVAELIPPHSIPENIKIESAVAGEGFVKNSIVGNDQTWQSQKEKYRATVDEHFKGVQAEVLGQGPENTEINGPKAHVFPMFVKINVFAPNTLNFGKTSKKLDENDPREYVQFWYQDWYMILSILNKFVDGAFTQELDIRSFDVFGSEVSNTTGGVDKAAHDAMGAGGVVGADGSVTAVSDKKPELYGGETRGKAPAADSATSQNYGNEGSKGRVQQASQNVKDQYNKAHPPVKPPTSQEVYGNTNILGYLGLGGDEENKKNPPPPQLPGV